MIIQDTVFTLLRWFYKGTSIMVGIMMRQDDTYPYGLMNVDKQRIIADDDSDDERYDEDYYDGTRDTL